MAAVKVGSRSGAQMQQALPEMATKLIENLKSRNDKVRLKAAKGLRAFVEAEAREMSGESLSKLMHEINRRISELINSTDMYEKLGGIEAVDQLIDVECEDKAMLVTRFANFLRMILPSNEQQIMVKAARALGHLARSEGTLTADVVEFEVKRVLEWLHGERIESRMHAAVLVLTELATNAPTLFYVHVSSFLDHIWKALYDQRSPIREGAVNALRACLKVHPKRKINPTHL